ncbi:hypothetical protein D3P07_25545 [Paenibacillus sp. 1011MAR3C5]|uniref:YfjL-like protein n=1 Tax=Paenibacillus sp. 1011MAR3C5 TaxID=1675787 RepID=UPI000E6BDC49|nr:hypothetical protein [Paenibacillus sp. 1011MAR3C5]RJE83329.1 hypothetical protein D3P07_25545 [Paenibacillus sp. 1011MAR3C5]
MKTSRKKMMRVIAGIIAFSLIGLILFVTNAFVGNPISSAIAKSAIERHIAAHYPKLEYEFVSRVGYNFKDSSYIAQIQSRTSADTRFYVEYHGKHDIRDDYSFKVMEYDQTLHRLSKEYAAILEKELSEQLGIAIRHVFVMYQTEEVKDYKDMLDLDMKLNPRLPIPLHLNMSLDTDDTDLAEAAEWINRSYNWATAQGYPIKQYGMDVEFGEKLLMIYGVRDKHIAGGELLSILEKARANKEYDGIIVTIKGEDKG